MFTRSKYSTHASDALELPAKFIVAHVLRGRRDARNSETPGHGRVEVVPRLLPPIEGCDIEAF